MYHVLTLKKPQIWQFFVLQNFQLLLLNVFCFVTMKPLHSCQGLVEWTSFFPRCLDVVLVEKEEKQMMCAAATISTISTQNPKFHCWIRWSEDHVHLSFRWTWLHDQLFWVLREFGCHIVCPKMEVVFHLWEIWHVSNMWDCQRELMGNNVSFFSCYFETCFSMKITTSPKTSVAW